MQPIHPAAAASAAAWPLGLSATQALPQGPNPSAAQSAQPSSVSLARTAHQVVHSTNSTGMTARPSDHHGHTDLQVAPSARQQQQQGFAAATSQNPPPSSSIARTTQADQATSMPAASAPRHWLASSLNRAQPASHGFNNARPGQQQQQQFGRPEAYGAGQGRSSHLQPSGDNGGGVDPSLQMQLGRQVDISPGQPAVWHILFPLDSTGQMCLRCLCWMALNSTLPCAIAVSNALPLWLCLSLQTRRKPMSWPG